MRESGPVTSPATVVDPHWTRNGDRKEIPEAVLFSLNAYRRERPHLLPQDLRIAATYRQCRILSTSDHLHSPVNYPTAKTRNWLSEESPLILLNCEKIEPHIHLLRFNDHTRGPNGKRKDSPLREKDEFNIHRPCRRRKRFSIQQRKREQTVANSLDHWRGFDCARISCRRVVYLLDIQEGKETEREGTGR
jgi:hypothetical protein